MADLQEKIEKAAGLQLELRKLLLEIIGDIPGEGGGEFNGANLLNGSVTHEKLADSSVRNRNIGTGSVKTENLGVKTVTAEKLADDVMSILNSKLTATKAAAQADSTATDVEGLVADFNALLAKLRTAKFMATS
ncbi:hypothetical protein MOD76_19855 [Bacillus spizizenii]|nr:hypothetical protein [Bacillus spizizenii]MCY8902956.1 hypothetical protein [Bacillus spizizenii]MCY8907081.1 hypothetical protein [Bacillus spizizenii]